MTTDLIAQLQRTSLFQGIPTESLQYLSQMMRPEVYPTGTLLYRVGDSGDTLHIIQSGRVRIFLTDEHGQEVTLRHYNPPELFGEFALIDGKPRSASAQAVEELHVLALHREAFLAFITTHPQAGLAMMSGLAQRARYTTTYVEEVIRWVQRLARGEYLRTIEDIEHTGQESQAEIQNLVAAFLEMVQNIRKREDTLKQQLVQLQVKIDHEERHQQVQQITRSDFFAHLKSQAQKLREETGQL